MSFSKENRKEVFDFFVKILLTKDKPCYYEDLRGHVSESSYVVRKYVIKECKGEKLCEYFRKRKNYFIVSYRQEVSLRKRFKQFACKENLKSEEETECESEYSEELSNPNYSEQFSYDRSDSFASSCQSKFDSTDVDQSPCSDFSKEMIEYEEITMNYFIKYLSRNDKLNLHDLEFSSFPKKIQRYLSKYMKKRVVLFFQSYPDIFHVDDSSVRLLNNSLVKETFNVPEVQTVEQVTTSVVEELQQPTIPQNFKEQTIENFVRCAEFFVSILKKKSAPIYADKLSGHLSQAPKEILDYLKHNYKSFKDFFLDAPKLFIFNSQEEVYIAGDSSKLLKRAKKLLRLKSQDESFSESVPNVINSFFERSSPVKKRNSVEVNEMGISVVDIENLEFADINHLNQGSVLNDNKDVSNPSNTISEIHIDNKSISTLDEIQGNLPSTHTTVADNKCSKNQSSDFLISQSSDFNNDISNPSNAVAEIHIDNKSVSTFDELQGNLPSIHMSIADNECSKNQSPDFLISQSSDFNGMQNSEDTAISSICNINYPETCSNFEESITKPEKTQKCFKECVHNVHLICLEMVEKEFNLSLKFEFEAVEFFIKMLKGLPGRWCEISTLQGNLGQASRNIIYFMNNLYKGEKFEEFFEKQDEFILYSSWRVELSPNFQDHLDDRLNRQKTYIPNKMYFQNLCDSHWNNMCIHFFEGLHMIFSFLQNKERAKISRLSGRMAMFPTLLQNFINSLNAKEQTEKIKQFLKYFNFFVFNNEYVSLNPDIIISSTMDYLRNYFQTLPPKDSEISKLNNIDYSLYISKDISELEESSLQELCDLKNDIIICVKDYLCCISSVNYSSLLMILNPELFQRFDDLNLEFLDLIIILFESNLFQIENGEISLKKSCVNEDEISDESDFVKSEVKSDDIVLSNDNDNIKEDVLENLAVGKTFYKEKINQDGEICFENNEICYNEVLLNNVSSSIKDEKLESYTNKESFCHDTLNQSCELEVRENELCDETVENKDSCFKENVLENSSLNENLNKEEINKESVEWFENNKVCSDEILISSEMEEKELENSSIDKSLPGGTVFNSYITEMKESVLENFSDDEPSNKDKFNKDFELNFANSQSSYNYETDHLDSVLVTDQSKVLMLKNTIDEEDDAYIEPPYNSSDDIDTSNQVSHFLIANIDHDVASNCNISLKETANVNKQCKDFNYESGSTNHLMTDLSSENVAGGVANIEHSYSSSDEMDVNSKVSHFLTAITDGDIESSCRTDSKEDMGNDYKDLNYEGSSTNNLTNLSFENIVASCVSDKSETNDNFNKPSSVSFSLKEVLDDNKPYKDLSCNNSSTNHVMTNLICENIEEDDALYKSMANDNLKESFSLECLKDSDDDIPHESDHLRNDESSLKYDTGVRHFAKFIASSTMIFQYPPTPLAYINNYDEFIRDKLFSCPLENDEMSLNYNIRDKVLVEDTASSNNLRKSDSPFCSNESKAFFENVSHSEHDNISNDKLNDEYKTVLPNLFETHSFVNLDESSASQNSEYETYDIGLFFNVFTSSEENSTILPITESNANYVLEYNNKKVKLSKHENHISTKDVSICDIQTLNVKNETINTKEINSLNSRLLLNETFDVYRFISELENLDSENCNQKCVLKSEEIYQNSKLNINNFSRQTDLPEENKAKFIESSLDHESVKEKHSEIGTLHSNNIISNNIEINDLLSVNSTEFKNGENNSKSLEGNISPDGNKNKLTSSIINCLVDNESSYTSNDTLSASVNYALADTIIASKGHGSNRASVCSIVNKGLSSSVIECSVIGSLSNVANNESGNANQDEVFGASDSVSHPSLVAGQHAKSSDQKHDFSNAYVTNRNSSFSFMQPLSAKIILLSIDSCVAETALHAHVKLVFCLKSSFHCDQHNNCIKCFESLKIGDRVLCYIPPIENSSNPSNMYISFMMCKDSTSELEKSVETCYLETKKLCKRYQSSLCTLGNNLNHSNNTCDSSIVKIFPDYLDIDHKHYDSKSCQASLINEIQPYSSTAENGCLVKCQTFSQYSQTELNSQVLQHCSSAEKEFQVNYSVNSQNCQTDLSGNVKIYPSVFEKECQANCSSTAENVCLVKCQTFSQYSQTELNSQVLQHCSSVEKECQVNYSVNSQNCQTNLSGNVKICPSVVAKECQANCSQLSQISQTFYESGESACQTELSGKVKHCPSVSEKECQAKCSVFSQITQTFCKLNESSCQTELSGNVKLSPPVFQKECQAQCSTSSRDTQTSNKNVNTEIQTDISGSIKCCFNSSSLACQTVLSGPIKKCADLENKSSQSLPIPSLDQLSLPLCNMFSPPSSDVDLSSVNYPIPDFGSSECSYNENVAMEEETGNTAERCKELRDMACQTISTGAIIIMKYSV